jgi:hypothetical protein
MTIRDVESSWLEGQTGVLAKLRAASRRVERHVYPVYCEAESGSLEAVGSAVLGRLGERVYLVSAAHVFDNCETGVFVPQSSGRIEALEGPMVLTARPPGEGRASDRSDIGFVRLTAAEIDAFGFDNAVDLELVGGPPMLIVSTMFVALGYPLRDQRAAAEDDIMSGELMTLMTRIADEEAHTLARIDQRMQFLIRLQHRVVATRRSVGAPPSMRGMSGGGVWPVRLDGDEESLVPFFGGIIIEQPERYRASLAITRGTTIRYFARRFDDGPAT